MPFVHSPGCSHIAADALSRHPVLLVSDSADIAKFSLFTSFVYVGDATLLRQRVILAWAASLDSVFTATHVLAEW